MLFSIDSKVVVLVYSWEFGLGLECQNISQRWWTPQKKALLSDDVLNPKLKIADNFCFILTVEVTKQVRTHWSRKHHFRVISLFNISTCPCTLLNSCFTSPTSSYTLPNLYHTHFNLPDLCSISCISVHQASCTPPCLLENPQKLHQTS